MGLREGDFKVADISLADFEIGVRNLISDTEQAYWELYFAFRDLEARKVGRDSALEAWRRVHALYVEQSRGGEAALRGVGGHEQCVVRGDRTRRDHFAA